MEPHTIRMPDDLLNELAEEAEEQGMSRAGYIRSLLRQRTEYDELRRENERLRNEKRTIIQQRDEHQSLVRAVEEQRTLERERAEAGALTRLKWWWKGKPSADDETA